MTPQLYFREPFRGDLKDSKYKRDGQKVKKNSVGDTQIILLTLDKKLIRR